MIRGAGQLTTLLAAALLVLFILRIAVPDAETLGSARAIDGDSIKIGAQEFRLQGIDAPEYRQTCKDDRGKAWACGKEARRVLAGLMSRGKVLCASSRRDRYGRHLATCKAGKVDLNREIVRLGFAVTFLDPSLTLLQAEAEAKAARRGLWRGEFEQPSHWRDREKPMRGDMMVD